MAITCTENTVEIYFDSTDRPIEKVWPGDDVPPVGHMGIRTAAG